LRLEGTRQRESGEKLRNEEIYYQSSTQNIIREINLLSAELSHLPSLLGAHHILHISRIRVKSRMRLVGGQACGTNGRNKSGIQGFLKEI
jgi:hypothetical protein